MTVAIALNDMPCPRNRASSASSSGVKSRRFGRGIVTTLSGVAADQCPLTGRVP
jgi:hypothetical protein